MYRVPESMDWCDLERLAEDINGKLVFRRARCQHGRTRHEVCTDCEHGYCYDTHVFALGIGQIATWNGEPCIAVSDDGEHVAYLPVRYQGRIARMEPIELLKRASRPGSTGPVENIIRRILSRAYRYFRGEMMLSDRITFVLVPDVDAAAWADINQGRQDNIKRAIRYPGDGSAWVTRYGTDDLPFYTVYKRA